MKLINLNRNVINIQKCLLPDSDYVEKNYGSYCMINVPGAFCNILVKIGLNEPKQLIDTVFVDDSVVVFETGARNKKDLQYEDIDFEFLSLLPPVCKAIKITVTIVFNDAVHLQRGKHSISLTDIVNEILKLYVFSRRSVIFLQDLPSRQTNGIYCIEICEVIGDCKDANGIYYLNDGSEIFVNNCMSRKKYEAGYSCRREVRLGGLSQIYKSIFQTIEFSNDKQIISNAFKPSNKIIVIGPSGCGKTSVVQSVVRDTGSVLVEVLFTEISSTEPGEMEHNLEKKFNEAKIHSENGENCVILIENIEVLCSRKKNFASKGTVIKLISLLQEFDRLNGIVIIATTTNIDDVSLQLRKPKCFDNELEIMIPTQNDREEIISNILNYFNITCPNALIKDLAIWTPGFLGSDLLYSVQEGLLLYYKLKNDLNTLDYNVLEECFQKMVTKRTPTSLKGSIGLQVTKLTDFSDIGGLDNVKRLLNMSVKQQLLHPEAFRRLGVPLTKGILLYGPPGCAKTTLVKALAKDCNTTFLAVSSADLYSPFLGDPEKRIVQLFAQARIGAPSIIFIDEIDGLIGSKSGDRMRGVQERVLSTLLVEMDGVGLRVPIQRNSALSIDGSDLDSSGGGSRNTERSGIIVIGATNRPDRIDDALKRPGRFDKIVYVPPPDENERLSILKTLTRKMSLSESVDLEYIAGVTNLYSGADLKNLCYESALVALKETDMTATSVDQSHFEQVLRVNRPSLSEEMFSLYKRFQKIGR